MDERAEATLVVNFLLSDPEAYGAVLTMARLQQHPTTLEFEGDVALDGDSVEARKRRIERYFYTAHFGACPYCFQPTATFADGRKLEWPELDVHSCDGMHRPRLQARAIPL
jgi:hypothetical protein